MTGGTPTPHNGGGDRVPLAVEVAISSQIDIYNLALSALKLSQRVQSLTEQSPQAGWCNTFWDKARKKVLEQCYWSFATKAAALSLLVDQLTITNAAQIYYPGWRFIYSMPTDSLKMQAVTSQYGIREYPLSYWWSLNMGAVPGYSGLGVNGTRPPWKLALDQTNANAPGQQLDILTDQPCAWGIYTTDPPNVAILPETWADCVALHLGELIGGPLSASEGAIVDVQKRAPLALSRALAKNLNEEQPDHYPESPAILARQ